MGSSGFGSTTSGAIGETAITAASAISGSAVAAVLSGGNGKIRSGSMPSVNSGASDRPHPRERSPPKPVSANKRNAAFTFDDHFSCADSSKKETTVHRPDPARNSMHAVEWRSLDPVKRSTPALDRTAVRNGPGLPAGTRQSLGPSTLHRFSSMRWPARIDCTTVNGTKRALFQRTRAALVEGDAGGQTVRGGTTNTTSPRNGKQELNETAGVPVRAVASSHSSSQPIRDMAAVTAE
jgi:hypothetical protein